MKAGLLSWSAQVAGHAAYVEARRIARAAPTPARSVTRRAGRRTTEAAERNRAALLHALQDRRPHPFRDLRDALPELSCQGVYYLVDALGAQGLITVVETRGTRRTYQLTQGDRHEH